MCSPRPPAAYPPECCGIASALHVEKCTIRHTAWQLGAKRACHQTSPTPRKPQMVKLTRRVRDSKPFRRTLITNYLFFYSFLALAMASSFLLLAKGPPALRTPSLRQTPKLLCTTLAHPYSGGLRLLSLLHSTHGTPTHNGATLEACRTRDRHPDVFL